MNISVKLTSGWSIHLQSLLQTDTYGGFLEGEVLRLNQEVLKRHTTAPRTLWPNLAMHCINEDLFAEWSKSKFPPVQCCGYFLSCDVARDETKDASALVVIWFQDDIYPTLSPDNEMRLKNLDWKKYALDFDW